MQVPNASLTPGVLQPRLGKYGFVLGISPQLGCNRFESPSLPDSENLTKQWQVVMLDGTYWL
jgi:hypothetical protein